MIKEEPQEPLTDDVIAMELMAIRRWIGIACPRAVKVHNLEMDQFAARAILLDAANRLDPRAITKIVL